MNSSVLVVGAGIAGVSCALELHARGIPFRVVNKGRKLGGRMASRVVRDSGTTYDGRVFDIGASYFTVSDPDFAGVVSELENCGVVSPWTDTFHVADADGIQGVKVGPMRYRAPGGIRSVVEHLAAGLPAGSITEGEITDLKSVRENRIALCMPTPQSVRLYPSASDLSAAVWEPVIAVSMLFEPTDAAHWQEFDGVFVNDDSAVTWIAHDGSRRGDGAPALVAHVHPVLSSHHLSDPATVIPFAVAAVQRVLGLTAEPTWASAHRWTFAKPLEGTAGNAESGESFIRGDRVSLAGDEFSPRPRVEAAWISGRDLGRSLTKV